MRDRRLRRPGACERFVREALHAAAQAWEDGRGREARPQAERAQGHAKTAYVAKQLVGIDFRTLVVCAQVIAGSGASAEERKQVLESAERPNGSFNVSKAVRGAWELYFDKQG